MQCRTIQFTGKDEVQVVDEAVEGASPGMLLIRTTRTLISAGTEGTVLSRRFAPGTHWDAWVNYPLCPGYCHVGRVIGVGEGVTGFDVGDRVVTRGKHASVVLEPAQRAIRIPDTVSDDDAS